MGDTRTLYERMLAGVPLPTMIRDNMDGTFTISERKHSADGNSFQLIHSEIITYEQYGLIPGMVFGVREDADNLVSGAGYVGATLIGAGADIRLQAGERGLVLETGITRQPDNSIAAGPGLDSAELRTALFLWDKLDWPKHNIVEVEETAETAFLKQEGILLRTEISHVGNLVRSQWVLDSDLTAFQNRKSREPGRWSLGRGQSADVELGEEAQQGHFVQLTNLVTIPDVNVPLDEVLEFRLARRSELIALREEIDAAYQRIAGSADGAHAWVAESDKLVAAVEAQRRVAAEAGWKSLVSSVAANVSFKGLGAAGAAAMAEFQRSASLASAAVAGIGAGTITATIARAKTEKNSSPYRYLLSIYRLDHARPVSHMPE